MSPSVIVLEMLLEMLSDFLLDLALKLAEACTNRKIDAVMKKKGLKETIVR